MDDSYKQDKQIDLHEYLHLYMLGVAPEQRGKGIAQTLVSTTLEHGMEQGYKVAVTEAANQISQHVFRKTGFTPRCEISYGQFTYNGDSVFEAISEEGGTILMDKCLNRLE